MNLKELFLFLSRIFDIKSSSRRKLSPSAEQKYLAGVWGEGMAVRLLKRKGFSIVGTRVRPNRRDEIDIVAKDSHFLLFVEVKTRKNELFGRPAAAVDRRKRHALCRAAKAYLRTAGYPDCVYRFDIVEVIGEKEHEDDAVVRHLEDAFRFPAGTHFPIRKRGHNKKS